MTEKQFILKLQQLKQIKPNQEWVVLAKNQIFAKPEITAVESVGSKFAGLLEFLPTIFFQRKFAYVFSAMLLLAAGLLGAVYFSKPSTIKEVTIKSQAAISSQSELQGQVANFTERINSLAEATKQGKKENLSLAINKVKESAVVIAKNLKENMENDAQSVKEVADQVEKIKQFKALADLSGSSEIQELNNALLPIVQNEITDLEKATLTETQQEALQEAKSLFEKGKYADALEKILMINK